jgi:MAST domain-containing protein
MKLFLIILLLILGSISLMHIGSASNPYGEIYEYDLYFNGKLLDVSEVPHPTLRIGEPFKVRVDFTVHQKCYVSLMLSEIENGNFEIVAGPTSKMDDYGTEILDKSSTKIYEWTIKPTDKWSGGSLPIDLVYQINDFETGDILVNSRFTIAYPYISNEYYEGEAPASETQPTQEQQASENSSSPTASAPAFSLVTAILAFALVFFRFSHR